MMREGYLTRTRLVSPADQRGTGRTVMRRAKRALAPAGGFEAPRRDGVDCRDFQRLGLGKLRQDARKASCQHRLARSRRSYHQHAMAAGRSYLEGSLDLLLSLDV